MFGQPNNSPFGSPPPQQQGGFGAPPNINPAPAFGSPAAPFGGGGFAAAPPAGGFGGNPSFGGGGGFAPPASSGFNNNNNNVSFGQPQQQQQQQSMAVPNPFGGAPAGSSGFGGGAPPANTGFGQPAQQQPMGVPNPFGGAPSAAGPAPSVSFGMSSNVMMNNNTGGASAGMTFGAPASSGFGAPASSGFGASTSTGFGAPASSGFGNASTSTGFGNAASSTGFGNAASSTGFGSAPAAATSFSASNPFGGSSSGGMTFGQQQHNRQQSSGSVEMGGSDSPTPMSAFGGTFHSTTTGHSGGGLDSGSLSPIPEDQMGGDPFHQAAAAAATQPSGQDFDADKLARLKAKLEAKKKKLMDRQNKKKSSSNPNDDDGGGGGQEAPPPQAKQQFNSHDGGGGGRGHRRDRSMSPLPPPPSDAEAAYNKARAERNAIRFATTTNNTATKSYMPTELKGKTNAAKPSAATSSSSAPATKASVTSAVGGEANREDLATAKSLVGTCMYMCPDEELLRRERENDIQLLEIPDPGGIHPPNWTLRNTVVKRFRRSAADYKLDVPEWIRPPDVLEVACSYLEEWVMERDRQGPDRRFPQNGTPVSLDVYQFIWDRTRMIRKDFILQNYVGTGGKCDARAVRCHERIARWHAMCEHQLSHINDFVVQQSQQNIAELGQAMKTLNQFYDDSYGRAYIEVPDDEGRETRAITNDYSHGCGSDICQGGNPVDYDGSPLNNAADDTAATSRRLIGKAGANSPSRGTAEPEMRGLYILLTMNNDGGMEVMKYTAALYRERPEIYHSKPVQLALDIFNAKRDYNYVRFFRILRDPSTPYLFACLMFKHIELMRKIAFRIMNKTYGAKKKDTGEPFYDEYPLKRLAQVLCFEDMEEAREACRHYNITVKEGVFRSGGKQGTGELVFWRHTDFKEPRDPAKGTILPLRPRKMLRTIESKLRGATRLGVCRGEVSGEGASIAQPPARTSREENYSAQSTAPPRAPAAQPVTVPVAAPAAPPSEDEIKRQQERAAEEEKRRLEEAKQAKLRKEEERRLKAEEQLRLQREQEKKRQLEKQEAARQAEEKRKQQEAEEKRKAKEEKEERERQEKAAMEAKRLKELRDEEERQRRLKEEEARKKAEAEEKERQRIEAIRKEEERKQRERREEEERRRREEAERVRQEQERRRLEALRAQEEERKRQEALARKAAQELEQRVNKARKLLLLRRWREKLPRAFTSRKRTLESLKLIDPTFSLSSPFTVNPISSDLEFSQSVVQPTTKSYKVDTRRVLNRILSKPIAPLDVTSLLLQSISGDDELMHHLRSSSPLRIKGAESMKATFLFKVAVFVPEPVGLEEETMYESIHTWLNRRLEYGKIDTLDGLDNSGKQTSEVRVLFVKADSWGGHVTCDAAMFVIPPSFCSDWNSTRKGEALFAAFDCVDQEVPRVAFCLGESFDAEYYKSAHQFLADCLPSDTPEFPVIFPNATSESALEGCLQSSLKSLIQSFTMEFPPLVEQVSVVKLACKCISDALWTDSVFESLESARAATVALVEELDCQSRMIEDSWSGWPAHDFVSEAGYVENYFADGIDLPTVWARRQFCFNAQIKLQELLLAFEAASVPEAIGKLLQLAPIGIRHECDELLERRQYRMCIQRVLQSGCIADEMLILPQGTAEEIAAAAIQRAIGSAGKLQNNQKENDGDKDGFSSEVHGGRAEQREEEADNDEEKIFEKAQKIFEASRTISPVPLSMINTPSPNLRPSPSATGTGASSNNKRSWTGMSSVDERGPSPLQSPFTYAAPTPESFSKRPRASSYRSKDELESSAFTRKLQALLEGTACVDMEVGSTNLSSMKMVALE